MTDFEIDHILPQAKFEEARRKFKMPADFELHGVANLAPVCSAGRRCNQEKGDAIDDGAGAIDRMLTKAQTRADQVTKAVHSMRLAKGVERDLLHALSAPLDQTVRSAFRDHGPLLAQRLHAVDPALVEAYTLERTFDLDVGAGSGPGCLPDKFAYGDEVVLPLDEDGRAAYAVAKTLLGTDLDDVIGSALEELITQLDSRVDAEGHGEWGFSHGGFDIVGHRAVALGGLKCEVDEHDLVFTLGGSVDSEHSASVAQIDQNGDTQYGQCDVHVEGRFIIYARCVLPGKDLEIEVDDSAVDVSEI